MYNPTVLSYPCQYYSKPPFWIIFGGAVDLNTDNNLKGILTVRLLTWNHWNWTLNEGKL